MANVLDTSYSFEVGGVTYLFTTELAATVTHAPTAAWYLDFAKKQDIAQNLLVANRFPPPPISAFVEGQAAEPYALEDGHSLTVATPSYGAVENGTNAPWAVSNGQTLQIRIDGGYTQTIILSGVTDGAATPQEVAASIHDQIRLARATVTSAGTRVTLTTKEVGADGSVEVAGGTAALAMAWPASVQSGGAGTQTVTFAAVAGTTTTTATALYALSDFMQLTVAVDGGAPQTVTFLTAAFEDIAQATAQEVADVITTFLTGASGVVAEDGAKVSIVSATNGHGSSIEVTGGTANAVLAFPGGAQAGSGDFEYLQQATAAEVKAYLNASLTGPEAVVADGGTRVRLVAPTDDRLVCSGEAAYVLALAAQARATSGALEPYLDLTDGQTLTVKIDGGAVQTIALESTPVTDVAGAPAEFIAELLDAALVGASAFADADGTRIVIRSDTQTAASSVQVTGGTANAVLAFSTTVSEGAGRGAAVYGEGLHDEDIELELFDAGVSGWAQARVWVTTGFVTTLVYDSLGSTAGGWSVTQAQTASPGSGVNDVWRIVLSHTISFVSDERVTVRVLAENNLAETLDETWYFYAEDTKQPFVSKISMTSPRKLRVQYSEPMNQGTDYTSAVYFDDVSGRVSYHKTIDIGGMDYENVIVAPTASFAAGSVGLFLGSWGAQNAVNNGAFEIVQVLATNTVKVDATLADEDAADLQTHTAPTLVLTPYRIARADPGDAILPTAAPIVVSATAVSESSVPSGAVQSRFVDVELIDDLTPNAVYNLEVVGVADLAGNPVGSIYPFTSWQLKQVPDREWNLWDMIPAFNKEKDVTQDLERFIKTLDEAAQLLLHDVDRFGDLLDPMAMKDDVVDVLLESLGNPLSFVGGLNLDKKRDLIPLLVPMYKLKGVAKGIEDAVTFFVGKDVIVVPWTLPADTWTVGSSLLGHNTYVGPSKSYVRYSFRLQHTEDLTDTDKSRIEEIVDFIRPAHTHFVGYLQV